MTAISNRNLKQSAGQTILFAVLAFWLSGSLFLDGVVMPTLYASGMMTAPGFASAGYSLFWLFNRVELLCAAVVLTSVLVLRYTRHPWNRSGQITILLSILLLSVALMDTYGLAPQMSALGLRLDWFTDSSEPPALMNQLHAGYWLLETLKLAAGGILLWLYNRTPAPISQL